MNSTGDFETARCCSSLELRAHQLRAVGVKAWHWAFTAGWSQPQACRLSQPKLSSFAAKPYVGYLLLTAGKLPPMCCRTLLAQPGWVVFSFFFATVMLILSQGMWENSSILPDTYSLEGKVIWVMSEQYSGWLVRPNNTELKNFYLQPWMDQLV